MILKALSLAWGSSTAINRAVSLATLLSLISGGLLWGYNAIKEKGATEAKAEELTARYAVLEKATGAAILKLNQQHSATVQAAAARRAAEEASRKTAATTIYALQKELDHARKTDDCIDRPIPTGIVDRLRGIAGGTPGGD